MFSAPNELREAHRLERGGFLVNEIKLMEVGGTK